MNTLREIISIAPEFASRSTGKLFTIVSRISTMKFEQCMLFTSIVLYSECEHRLCTITQTIQRNEIFRTSHLAHHLKLFSKAADFVRNIHSFHLSEISRSNVYWQRTKISSMLAQRTLWMLFLVTVSKSNVHYVHVIREYRTTIEKYWKNPK